MADDIDRYRAPALDKGLDILEALAVSEHDLSQADICKALDRSPNEIYRMLDRLVRRDYVRRTAEDRYALTLKLFELGHAQPPLKRLINEALPRMRRFAAASQQACHLAIYDRGAMAVVTQVDSPGYWNVSLKVGSRMGLADTGSGRVCLAYAAPEERRAMLAAQEQGSKAGLSAELETRLDQVRKQGFEAMESAQIRAVSNLSAPVIGPLGSVLAVLTCPYAERLDRPDTASKEEALALLLEAAAALSLSPSENAPDRRKDA
jgi:DNA-binding IclR family transcriptional regulator